LARYFLELAYNGTRYHGFQIQPNDNSIQESIQKALATILQEEVEITGCGRTDAGVHALQYFAHFDFDRELPKNTIISLNALLKRDIVIHRLINVQDEAHARFDARSRSYLYKIDLRPDPFHQETAYYCPFASKLDKDLVQEAARLLLNYSEFDSFCLAHTDVHTKICRLTRSEWDFQEWEWTYHVSADRFLRGMIRLIVGMCLNVGRGKVSLEELKYAMERKLPLKQAWSVPAEGLFLTDIKYDFIKNF
jgi:tRNA pseudouridine38-40 synthase